MDRINIYLVDDSSYQWHIANELVSDYYKNRFIITTWDKKNYRWDNNKRVFGIGIYIKYFDGKSDDFFISKEKLLKLNRKVKIFSLTQDLNFFTIEQCKKINHLVYISILHRITKHILSKTGCGYVKNENINKESRKEKRQALAKANKGNNKSKNK